MSSKFVFGSDVRIDTNDLAPADAEEFGKAIGRTFAAAVLVGAVVTVACPNPATAEIIAGATLREVQTVMPHTVVQRSPEIINEAQIEAIHAKASELHYQQEATMRTVPAPQVPNQASPDLDIT